MSGTEPSADARPIPWWGLACIGFVFLAVVLEIIAGTATAGRTPGWVYVVVPPTWPPAGRVLWWLGVAAAAGGYRLAERRAGIRRHPIVVVLTVLPFVAFAYGAATDAGWAAFH